MKSFVLVLTLLVPAVAAAQETNDVNITLQVMTDPDADPLDAGTTWRDMTELEKNEFFNIANCVCLTPMRLELERTSMAPTGTPFQVWLGARCDDATNEADRNTRCNKIEEFEFPTNTPLHRVIVGADELMFPPTAVCTDAEATQNVFVLVDEGNDRTYESISTSEDIVVDAKAAPAVTAVEAKGGEDAIVVTWELPAEGADDIRSFQVLCELRGAPIFPSPVSAPDYDVCPGAGPPITPATDAGVPDAPAPPIDADLTRPDADLTLPDAATPGAIDAGPPAPDGGTPGATIEQLHESFICSGILSRTETSARVNVPADLVLGGDEIHIILVEIDDHKNPRAIDAGYAAPEPVADFWEVYEDQGGLAEGGFCFVATAAYGSYDHPFVVVLRDFRDGTLLRSHSGRALVRWYYRNSPPLAAMVAKYPAMRLAANVALYPTVLVIGAYQYTTAFDKLLLFALGALLLSRRVRRGAASHRRLATAPTAGGIRRVPTLRVTRRTATAALLLMAGARTATAQPAVYDEDWNEPSGTLEEPSQWAFELKFGPYVPDIDSELAVEPGPYERTFGSDWSLMMQMELDRFFVYPAGQLGLALGAGYMQNTADAFLLNTDGTPNYDMRSDADDTGFHLVPVALSVVYRFTWIADQTPVPLVPYLKGGLSYYLWWITKGDGSVTDTMNNGSGYGGTLGVQGTIGLSLRADKLDPNAARNLSSELGVEHAGFFIEGTYAAVNGLGMARRLHVGDLTWFAGVNFEF